MYKFAVFIILLLVLSPACGVKAPPLPPLPPEQAEKLQKEQEAKAAKDAALRKAIEEDEKTSGEKNDD